MQKSILHSTHPLPFFTKWTTLRRMVKMWVTVSYYNVNKLDQVKSIYLVFSPNCISSVLEVCYCYRSCKINSKKYIIWSILPKIVYKRCIPWLRWFQSLHLIWRYFVPIMTTTTFLVRRRMKVDTIELKSFGTYSSSLNFTILYLCEKFWTKLYCLIRRRKMMFLEEKKTLPLQFVRMTF